MAATATAAPPLDPPDDLELPYIFGVIPKSLFAVCAPTPSSAVFVLPIIIAPELT